MVAFVQAASNTAAASSVTVTLGANTTPGNCLVVCIALGNASSLASVASVKLGGVNDNFAQLKAVGDLTTGAEQLAVWADPSCAGGQTAVAVTLNVATATLVWVFEFSGIAASSILDQSATFDSAGGTNSAFSVTTGATTQASELAVGCVYGFNTTITGPASPWVNESTVTSGTRTLQAGYDILSSTGTVTYSGSFGAAEFNGQIVVTLKTPAAAVGAPLRPQITVPAPRPRRGFIVTPKLAPPARPVLFAGPAAVPRPGLRSRALIITPRSLLASPPPVIPGKPVLAAPLPLRPRPRGRAVVLLPRAVPPSPPTPPVIVPAAPARGDYERSRLRHTRPPLSALELPLAAVAGPPAAELATGWPGVWPGPWPQPVPVPEPEPEPVPGPDPGPVPVPRLPVYTRPAKITRKYPEGLDSWRQR